MEQNYIFIFLCFVIIVILLYQYLEYSKIIDNFNIEKIDGNITIEDGAKIKIGQRNTDDDAVIYSGGTLHVNEITTNAMNVYLDEDILKKMKSFIRVRRMDSKKGDKLCLKDKDGDVVCCSKEELGILTGQTPFKLKLVDKKIQPIINGEKINVKNDKYPELTGLYNHSRNKNIFYNKNFIIKPECMHPITSKDRNFTKTVTYTDYTPTKGSEYVHSWELRNKIQNLYNDLYSIYYHLFEAEETSELVNLINKMIKDAHGYTLEESKELRPTSTSSSTERTIVRSLTIPSDNLTFQNNYIASYSCNIENKSPDITMALY